MLPALNIPALVSPPYPIPLAPSSLSTALRAFSTWGLFYNTVPTPVPVPVPVPLPFLCYLPLPLSVLSRLPFPLPILRFLLFPVSFLTALRIFFTFAIIIVIAIARTAASNARRSGICAVLIIIILINYRTPIQWSNGQEIPWFVLPAAWQLNPCPEIITTIPRETLAGAFNLPQAGCLWIGVIHLIPEGTGVVPSRIVLLSRVLSNICSICERNAALHSRKGELALLLCGHINWNWEMWRVVTASRKIIPWKRSHPLSSLTPQTLYIHICRQMGSEMNLFIRSQSNNRRWFITNVGISTLAFPFSFWLPFVAIAVSWKWIYIWSISIIIQLHVAEGSQEGKYKVVWVIACVLGREALFCASHVMSR